VKLLSSLTNRIFIASAALTMLCIGVAIYLVNARVTASAEDELRRGLEHTGAVVEQQRATVSALFGVLARTVADLPKLKAAVATGDPPTVEPIATEYRQSVHSDLFLVDDASGRVLASIGRPRGVDRVPASLQSVSAAHHGQEARTFLVAPGGLLEMISVPITAGPDPAQIVGTLTLGFLLDDVLALRLKQLTGSEISFAAGDRIVASTLPPEARPPLQALLSANGMGPVWAGGEEYLALVRPLDLSLAPSLFGGDAESVRETPQALEPRPATIILRSRTDRLRLLRPIQAALVVTALAAVLLAIGLSYAIALTITRPLAAITDAMKRMTATGDLTRKIDWQSSRWEDEDARLLARTFNTLTGSITRFQREAAERERLSALGRLSTVIAHEVRNPLMIIKASLRSLTRENPSPQEVREAAADIDEEVGRLNRLINEVLDFARPMRFELAPVDLADLCTTSLSAATAGGGDVSVRLSLDRSIGSIVTDAERVRSALVNLLVNACQAVAARRSAATAVSAGAAAAGAEETGDEAADVSLATESRGGGRVSIVVADRGIGIDASELPRVFDPYFTTKRTGTGLGLAITRNIIEGLGGTIEIASERGRGTEIRIELPANLPQEASV
jgi:signal transduction histidine kinase